MGVTHAAIVHDGVLTTLVLRRVDQLPLLARVVGGRQRLPFDVGDFLLAPLASAGANGAILARGAVPLAGLEARSLSHPVHLLLLNI